MKQIERTLFKTNCVRRQLHIWGFRHWWSLRLVVLALKMRTDYFLNTQKLPVPQKKTLKFNCSLITIIFNITNRIFFFKLGIHLKVAALSGRRHLTQKVVIIIKFTQTEYWSLYEIIFESLNLPIDDYY